MFDIGFWELLLLAVIGLLVLGPERLPRAIRSLQRMSQRMKAFSSRMEAEINHELRVKELHENLKKIESSDTDELSPELKRSLEELQAAAESVRHPYSKEKSSEENNSEAKNSRGKSSTAGNRDNQYVKGKESNAASIKPGSESGASEPNASAGDGDEARSPEKGRAKNNKKGK